jgi:hypothetical protein
MPAGKSCDRSMNPLYATTTKGTLGELVVQLRFLEHNIQAAPPIKDSGNDLIAIRGPVFRAIQVRTTTRNTIIKPKASVDYHILAVVKLPRIDGRCSTRGAEVFLFPRQQVSQLSRRLSDYPKQILTEALINRLFQG